MAQEISRTGFQPFYTPQVIWLYSAWPRMMPCCEFGFEAHFGLSFYGSLHACSTSQGWLG